jgi:hypothetical protein
MPGIFLYMIEELVDDAVVTLKYLNESLVTIQKHTGNAVSGIVFTTLFEQSRQVAGGHRRCR